MYSFTKNVCNYMKIHEGSRRITQNRIDYKKSNWKASSDRTEHIIASRVHNSEQPLHTHQIALYITLYYTQLSQIKHWDIDVICTLILIYTRIYNSLVKTLRLTKSHRRTHIRVAQPYDHSHSLCLGTLFIFKES